MKTKPTFSSESEILSGPSTMNTTLIQNLVNNYRNNQLSTINSNLSMDDARSIRFDLNVLKKFIADIESEVQKVDTNINGQDLGIRFYYAAYPSEENWDIMENQSVEPEYAGKHTLVMIPTLKMKDENDALLDYDFNPLDPSTYSQPNNIEGNAEALTLDSRENSTTSTLTEICAQNHGQLIPPADPKTETY
ncbi:hypothetical protein HNP38_003534 [Chryseobacterium defluvii]|uniref:Uncharacterized protein n=1 Tax=Chryseobacterium defluvii TaxID=160396 RepID=A0A840KL30_9FLAO|nr:hypothetical protein [Chryseobacterium defluvii]MBB4808193.1 hypothetical protein [Chryseobacterium defluvii]